MGRIRSAMKQKTDCNIVTVGKKATQQSINPGENTGHVDAVTIELSHRP